MAPVPSGYWACTPLDTSPAAAVFSTAFNPWLFELHPVRALRQSFLSLLSGQVLAGVEPGDICVCDNFYTPHLTEYWGEWLVAMVDELAALVRRFGVPVISGKDSSAGSTHTDEGIVSVPSAVFLSGLGKVPDHRRLLGEAWTRAGSLLVRIGPASPSLAGTVAARVLGFAGGVPDEVSLDQAERFIAALRDHRGLFRSGTRIGAGGVAARLVMGALASGLGVDLDSSAAGLAALFAEHRLAALVEIDQDDLASLPVDLDPVVVGSLTGDGRITANSKNLLTPGVRQAWTNAFSELIA
jgi:phosphoribosylformylglycinamidine (FGAM) synthase-like enzyme